MASLFISEDYIKNSSLLDYNVDQKLIEPLIFEQQQLRILPILGTDLYNRIDSDISGASLAGDYLELVNSYIAPALKYWVLYESPLSISYKMRNNGALKQSNENGQPVSLQELDKLEDRFRTKAEQFTIKLEYWLHENCDKFPEYTDNDDDGDIKPSSNSIFFGIHLGSKRNRYVHRKGYDYDY